MSLPKERLYQLIDQLPESELAVVERFLEFVISGATDPVLQAFLKAPYNDEPLTEQELEAIHEGEVQFIEGKYDNLDDVTKELIS
jgi:hypothetical protein